MKTLIRYGIGLLFLLPLGLPGQSFDERLSAETTRALLESLSGLPPPIGGPIPQEDYLELRNPLILTLLGGREFEGTVAKVSEDQIQLRLVQEGGEVVLSFPFEEVLGIRFSGKRVVEETVEMVEAGRLNDALPYLESIIASRYALFPLIPPEELSFFRALPLAALAVENPAQAIAYVRAIDPYLILPEDQRFLRDVELLAYYHIQLREEAEKRAHEWIEEEEEDFNESALGYFILSILQFERGEYEASLETALHPIVFSGALRKSYLAPCYSLAIVSSHLLGDPVERDKLIAEMRHRQIAWQPMKVFEKSIEGLSDFSLLDSEGNRLPLLPESDTPPILLDSGEAPPKNESALDSSNTVLF